MDASSVVGLRDRAIVAVMAFTFARVSAVVALHYKPGFWFCGRIYGIQIPD
jgi:hypothetical protein